MSDSTSDTVPPASSVAVEVTASARRIPLKSFNSPNMLFEGTTSTSDGVSETMEEREVEALLNYGDGASSGSATDDSVEETFVDLSNAELKTSPPLNDEVQGKPENKRKRKDSNENVNASVEEGTVTALSSAQSILLRRSMRAKANTTSQAPSTSSAAQDNRASKGRATQGKEKTTATGRKPAKIRKTSSNAPALPFPRELSDPKPNHNHNWLPAFATPQMHALLTRFILEHRWAKHVNDLRYVPTHGLVFGKFSLEEHRVCDVVCVGEGISVRSCKSLRRLPSLERAESVLGVRIPEEVKRRWRRERGVEVPLAPPSSEGEIVEARESSLAQGASSLDVTTLERLENKVEPSEEVDAPSITDETAQTQSGDISSADIGAESSNDQGSVLVRETLENPKSHSQKDTVSAGSIVENSPPLVESENNALASSLPVEVAAETTPATTVQPADQQSAPSVQTRSPATQQDDLIAHPTSEGPLHNVQLPKGIYNKSYAVQQTFWKHQGQIDLNPTPTQSLVSAPPTASGSVQMSLQAGPSSSLTVQPTHMIPFASTLSTSTAIPQSVAQPPQASAPKTNYPIIPIEWGYFNHTGPPEDLLVALDAWVKETRSLPSHIDGVAVMEARQGELSEELYKYSFDCALLEGLKDNAGVRKMVLAAAKQASSSYDDVQAAQLAVLAQALGGSPDSDPSNSGAIYMRECSWSLDNGVWNAKCIALVPADDEEAVKLHFQMAHKEVRVWSDEREVCRWGTETRCKARPAGKRLVGHGVELHLRKGARYPV